MAETDPSFAHRVFLPQALGAEEFLRVTFHDADGVVVFSHWQGPRCIAATPVRVSDTPELATLLVHALGHAVTPPEPPSGPPTPVPIEPAIDEGEHDAQIIPLRWHDR